MEEIRGLAATDSGEALTLNISRCWWPLLSTVCVIIYGHIISLPAIWYGLRVSKIDIIMAHLFSWNISINLNCTVGSLGMWLQGGTEFRRGHWRLHVGRGCSVERRIILSWLLSDSWKCATQRTETGVTEAIKTDSMSSVIRIHEHLGSAFSPLAHNPGSISSGDFQHFSRMRVLTSSQQAGERSTEMFMRQKQGICLYLGLCLTLSSQHEHPLFETRSCPFSMLYRYPCSPDTLTFNVAPSWGSHFWLWVKCSLV